MKTTLLALTTLKNTILVVAVLVIIFLSVLGIKATAWGVTISKIIGGAVNVPTTAATKQLYFGSDTIPAVITQVDTSTFTVVGSLVLNTGENEALWAISSGGFGYFVMDTNPTIIVKVNLATLTRVSALSLTTLVSPVSAAFADTTNNIGYFGTRSDPAQIAKVDLAAMTLTSVFTFSDLGGEEEVCQLRGSSTVGTVGYVHGIKCPFVAFNATVRVTDGSGSNPIGPDVGSSSQVFSATNNGTYILSINTSNQVIRASISPFATVVGILSLSGTGITTPTAITDSTANFAYFSTDGQISKVDYTSFTEVGTLLFGGSESNAVSSVIDEAGGYVYFGTQDSPGKVVKVRLSDFSYVGSVVASGAVLLSAITN